MTKITGTYSKLLDIATVCNKIPSLDEKGQNINDKLSWAIQRFSEKNKSTFEKYSKELEDLGREHATVDEKGNFLLDSTKNLMYTKDGQKKLNAAIEKLKAQPCEIDTYVCVDTTRSSKLHISMQRLLDGFVLTLDPEIRKFDDEEKAAEAKQNGVTSETTETATASIASESLESVPN